MYSTTVILLLAVTQSSFALTKIHMVYWNTTNPIFRIDNTDHIIDVNEGNQPFEYDQLNIICPHQSLEQHVIYSVSREEYDNCRVTNPKPKIVAICNNPQKFMYFTITFRPFSPSPNVMEFKPGQEYYLISTSTSRDIHRRVGGFCSSHNMKMVFKVADREDVPVSTVSNLYKSPMWSALRTTSPTTRKPSTSSIPVYYYKSRTPSVHTSDYIYYYSPRDLVQLKLAAKKHERQINTENETHASPLTSSSSLLSASALLGVLIVSLTLCL